MKLMQPSLSTILRTATIAVLLTGCVDPVDLTIDATVDLIVVDGTITNLAEPQIIRLNRSKADRLTGRFGTVPITKATVQVTVDSSRIVYAYETVDGSYQLPSDFKGQVGHAYQLRFWLIEGTEYVSSTQIMPAVPTIQQVYARFNPTSLPADEHNGYRLGHDFFVDTKDPADQHNYYRWDLTLYEKQDWCRSCVQGVYAVNNIIPRKYMFGSYYVSGTEPFEDCFVPVTYSGDFGSPNIDKSYYVYDYPCRTQCWEIIRNYKLNLFDDVYSNGGLISKQKVGQAPYYTRSPCLVVVRQGSLTRDTYQYLKLLQNQTQNTGGLADTPPTALSGNVRKVSNGEIGVIGYFSTSAVSQVNYWLDRKDVQGVPLGATDPTGPSQNGGEELFYALNKRRPNLEPSPPYTGPRPTPKILIFGGPLRVPTAVCVPSDSRTPFRPDGWRD